MHRRSRSGVAAAVMLTLLPLACAQTGSDQGASGGPPRGPDGKVSLEGLISIRLEPTDPVLTIASQQPATQRFTVLGRYHDGAEWEVTEQAALSSTSSRVGVFAENEFISATNWGGQTTVQAIMPNGLTATTGVAVNLSRSFFEKGVSADLGAVFDKAQPDPAASIEVVYPPKNVLVPPNLFGLELQWVRAEGQTLFEISFTSIGNSIRVYTTCEKIGADGCGYTIGEEPWKQIAATFAGSDPLAVQVRGVTDAGDRVGSSNSRSLSIAAEPIKGGIYYWNATSGNIVRYDFGRPASKASTFYSSSGSCTGCHALSFNGKRIGVVGGQKMEVLDVASRQSLATGSGSFISFSPDGERIILSGVATSLVLAEAATLKSIGEPVPGSGTMPDWSPDGGKVAYVESMLPTPYGARNGSIKLMSYDAATDGLGSATTLVAAADNQQNNYYPTFSPDGQLLAFNRVPSGTSYDATHAALWAVRVDGKGTPFPLEAANGGEGLSNSWPKFSPFVQQHRGHKLLWLTFSSRREHGLRTRKDQSALGGLPGPGSQGRNTAQIWMTAIDLGTENADPSHPAFWLPIQDPATGNHIAQWTAEVVRARCGLDGDCPQGERCQSGVCETVP